MAIPEAFRTIRNIITARKPDTDQLIDRLRQCRNAWLDALNSISIDGRSLSQVLSDSERLFLSADAGQLKGIPPYVPLVRIAKVPAAVLALTAAEMRTPPDISFERPLRTDRAVYFVRPEYADMIRAVSTAPVEMKQYMAFNTAVDSLVSAGASAGIPDLASLSRVPMTEAVWQALIQAGAPEDAFERWTVSRAGRILTEVWRQIFDESAIAGSLVDAVLSCNIYGFGAMLVELDTDRSPATIRWTNLPVGSFAVDPRYPDVGSAQWFAFNRFYPVSIAERLWPEAEIRGGISSAESFNFHWRSISKRLAEAGGTDSGVRAEGEEPSASDTVVVTTFFLREDDGIRIVRIANGLTILEDKVHHDLSDIPVIWFKSIPLHDISSPFGLGDPARLVTIQEAINRLATYSFEARRRRAMSMKEIAESAYRQLQKLDIGARLYIPDMYIPVPDEIMLQDRKSIRPIDEGDSVGEDVALMERLSAILDITAGYVDVLQGRALSGMSGALIDRLTENATAPLALKAVHHEEAIARGARISLDMMKKWFSEDDWRAYIPPQLVDEGPFAWILQMIQQVPWTVKVSVRSGRGLAEASELQQLLMLAQTGQISAQTILEKMDIDVSAEHEIARKGEEIAKMQRAVQAAAGGQAPQGLTAPPPQTSQAQPGGLT